jgi:hypothetical protein
MTIQYIYHNKTILNWAFININVRVDNKPKNLKHMSELNEILSVKEILSTAGPLIKAVIDTFVTPKLEKLKNRVNIDYKKYYVPSEENFSEYLHRTYKRISIIDLFHNSLSLLLYGSI